MPSPILIVDDDADDLMLVQEAVTKLNIERPIHFFRSGDELLAFLLKNPDNSPFFILCDLNLPGESGFELKLRIANDKGLHYKSVPFIFWSTTASVAQIQHAYDLPAQGFFFKSTNFDELCETFRTILGYWSKSQHPKRIT